MTSRAALVAAAEASIARGSKSFAAASKLFDVKTRERAWLLYAWCRACDDIADGQDHGHGMSVVTDAEARIATIRDKTARALAGETIGEVPFDALRTVVEECGIPHNLPFDVIEGFALDAQGRHPQDEHDLMRYCYHVAGAVGVMMAIVMGVSATDNATLDRACDLGIAFQLGNIARDIGEDHAAGRIYLPAEWLAEYGIAPEQLMDREYRAQLTVFARRLADGCEFYEASGKRGAAALSFRSAWAVLAAAHIYGGIAREVVDRGMSAWDERVSTSKTAKLGAIVAGFFEAALRGGSKTEPRNPILWNRPHRETN